MSETIDGTAELLRLRDKLNKLSPPDQLRVAAGLIEQGKLSLAETIAGKVVDELRLLRQIRLAGQLQSVQSENEDMRAKIEAGWYKGRHKLCNEMMMDYQGYIRKMEEDLATLRHNNELATEANEELIERLNREVESLREQGDK